MNNPDEEFIPVAGMIATAPYATPDIAPTSATEELDPAYTDHGLVSSDGVTRSESRTSTPRYAWQNRTKLKTIVSEAETTIQCVLVQTNEGNIELYHGAAMVSGVLVTDPGREMPYLQVVYDQTDGTDVLREYFPKMEVSAKGNQVATSGGGIGWDVTLSSTYVEDINGEGDGGHSMLFFSASEES